MKTKICISATGSNLKAALDFRFGRCPSFLILDEKGKLIKAVENTGARAARGAGVAAAQIAANEKVKAVITGNIGPSAAMVLNSSGIKVFLASPGTEIQSVFQQYKKGELQEAASSRGSGFGPGFGRRRGSFGGRGRKRR